MHECGQLNPKPSSTHNSITHSYFVHTMQHTDNIRASTTKETAHVILAAISYTIAYPIYTKSKTIRCARGGNTCPRRAKECETFHPRQLWKKYSFL